MEEGTPMVPTGGSRQYSFTAQPSGTRWYHTHVSAGKDLRRSLYSGQFGFFYIEAKNNPGNYDQEVFLAAHQWEPEFVSMQDIRKGPPPDNGMEVIYRAASLNDKALGHGEPIRVKTGARVLFHVLNASATDDIRLALPGHEFQCHRSRRQSGAESRARSRVIARPRGTHRRHRRDETTGRLDFGRDR